MRRLSSVGTNAPPEGRIAPSSSKAVQNDTFNVPPNVTDTRTPTAIPSRLPRKSILVTSKNPRFEQRKKSMFVMTSMRGTSTPDDNLNGLQMPRKESILRKKEKIMGRPNPISNLMMKNKTPIQEKQMSKGQALLD